MRVCPVLFLLACTSGDTGLGTKPDNTEGVVGNGKMEVLPTEVTLTDCVPTFSSSMNVTITSTGDANLLLYEVRIVANPDEIFFFEEVEDIIVEPGGSVTYPVVGTLAENLPADGELRIRNNSLEDPNFILPLHAWPVGYEPPDSGE